MRENMSSPPSTVLCLQTYDMTEDELKDALHDYGGSSLPVFLHRKKKMAFVQFNTIADAAHCLDVIQEGGFLTHEKNIVHGDFSRKKEVTIYDTATEAKAAKRLVAEPRKMSSRWDDSERDRDRMKSRERRDGRWDDSKRNTREKSRQRWDDVDHNTREKSIQRWDDVDRDTWQKSIQRWDESKRSREMSERWDDSKRRGVDRGNDEPHRVNERNFESGKPSIRPVNRRGCEVSYNDPPSPVLCIKGDVTEQEFYDMVNSFPRRLPRPVETCWRQTVSFLQYENANESQTVLEYLENNHYASSLTGKPFVCAFSLRKCIDKTEYDGPKVDEGVPNKVIMAIFRPQTSDRIILKVEDVIYSFMLYGMVERIVTFNKRDNTDMQVLVQYSDLKYAILAHEKMNNTFVDTFRVYIKYSQNPEINIDRNTDRTRNFTNPWLNDHHS